jgi:Ca-activated chloride channel homolog
MWNRNLIFILLSLLVFEVTAQNERNYARKGNKMYGDNKFVDAEVFYKKSLTKKPDFNISTFNLGDAYYKQKRYEDAAKQYELSARLSKNKNQIARSYHNYGNSLLESYKTENDQQKKEEKLNKAIDSYKNSLKNNPKDNDTKYNLSYAMQLKKMMQQNKNQQNQKQNKQDEQNQKKQDQKQQEKPKPQEQKEEISKKDAEKLLDAIQSQEKNVQQRLNKKQAIPVKVKIEKEW